MDAFIARQPIFDRKQSVFAYELLFRSGAENYFQPMDGDKATASLIDDSVHLHSVEKLASGRKCFINFTRKSLLDGLYTILPPALTVIEVLESVELDDELLAACQHVRDLGYTLALDDYILEPRFEPLLALIDILKVEFPVLRNSPEIKRGYRSRTALQYSCLWRLLDQPGGRHGQVYASGRGNDASNVQFAERT